jgi:cysteine synthase
MSETPPRRIDAFIGDTPLVRLERVVEPEMAEVWVKVEGVNPGGSIKDRTALAMICDAEDRGLLEPGGTIVEPTSGNTGIGLAQVASARGYRLILCLPASMSEERKGTLARVRRRAGAHRPGAADAGRHRGSGADPRRDRRILPESVRQPANPDVHYRTTGPEIWEGMQGRIDAFVYGTGTGGTISGVGRYLKERDSDIEVIAVEPARSAVLHGEERGAHKFQGMGPGFIPPNLDRSLFERVIKVWEEDAFPHRAPARTRGGALRGDEQRGDGVGRARGGSRAGIRPQGGDGRA